MAHNGTLFLDEIGEIPTSVQARLLRVLEEKSVMRIGQETNIPINVRIICATNRDLEKMVHEGQFREDLFYRLNVLRLELLPLRERREDIQVLIDHFLQVLPDSLGLPCPTFSAEARDVLINYRFPGNIRELRNIMERLVVVSRGGLVRREDAMATLRKPDRLPPVPVAQPAHRFGRNPAPSGYVASRGKSGLLQTEELSLIQRVLEETGGNKAEAARRLGISPSTLWRRLQDLKAME